MARPTLASQFAGSQPIGNMLFNSTADGRIENGTQFSLYAYKPVSAHKGTAKRGLGGSTHMAVIRTKDGFKQVNIRPSDVVVVELNPVVAPAEAAE